MFYSSTHKIYTRIDYFLISHAQLHAMSASSIVHITWSDHAPIFLTHTLSGISFLRHRFWSLNESLLQIPKVLADVSKELNYYFQTNDHSDCDPGSLWEAVLRGVLIKHSLRIKREHNEQLS